MPGVTNGAELVKRLRESGTPDGPLAPARACLHDVRATDRRSATADEVLAALESALGPDHGTVRKARNLIATGDVGTAAAPAVPIEDQLLAASGAADGPADGSEESEPEGGPAPEGDGLDGLTVAQLRETAAAEGVEGLAAKATKAEVVGAIRAARARHAAGS